MARRRRRDIEEDEEDLEKYRDDEDDRKSKGSRRRRREQYDRRQDFAMFVALIIIIFGILGGYFLYTTYLQGDEGDEEQFKTYTPPMNPVDPGNNNNNGGGSTIYEFPEPTPSDPTNTIVVMEIQDFGVIVMELYDSKVPTTVNNFKRYVQDGYYDGLLFHRVAQNPKVIQGGGFRPGMSYVEPTYSPINLEIDNSLTHIDGALAMARTSDPNSATSQFYISVGENHYLDDSQMQQTGSRGYAVFGQVIYGHDVYRTVNSVPVDNEAPINEIVIKRAYIY
jgi:cyclophilin family peptidyl-prolyl cis-trans isomerase